VDALVSAGRGGGRGPGGGVPPETAASRPVEEAEALAGHLLMQRRSRLAEGGRVRVRHRWPAEAAQQQRVNPVIPIFQADDATKPADQDFCS